MIPQERVLTDTQAQTLSPRTAAQPRCPKCQSRTEVRHIALARAGFEHWTVRCTSCGLIHEAQIYADPMRSDAAGWEHTDLQASQQGQ